MDILLQVFGEFLQTIGPLGGMGWLLSGVLGYLLFKEYRAENARLAALQTRVEELQKINADIRVAAAEERVEDLKELNKRYDTTARAILAALKKIGSKE